VIKIDVLTRKAFEILIDFGYPSDFLQKMTESEILDRGMFHVMTKTDDFIEIIDEDDDKVIAEKVPDLRIYSIKEKKKTPKQILKKIWKTIKKWFENFMQTNCDD
jgi:hypothetical protein